MGTTRTRMQLSLSAVEPGDWDGLIVQLNQLLSLIENENDSRAGLHGPADVWNSVTVHGDLTVTGRITSANGSNPPDASV